MKRFLLGLLCGAASGAVTYLVHPAPPWWWVIGLLVAIGIWTGDLLLDAIDGD
ncbi:hypothetical protein [Streptomyces sp. SID11385]|uniref:hypothetical protein n=1 Tax=Streptomyces sp. SID11385 TaxID=2706031 RepID=UPI0013C5E06A|nr:hypothetical protein [Streptomyces sp. SID11385]NEA42731.1 hypothetical protein [Streptomyces sp. SID11385]